MEQRKLNILIFNFIADPIGGSQYSTLAIAQELKRRGHNVFYASEKGELVKVLEQSGIKHYEIPLRKFMPYMEQFSIRSIFKLIKIISDNKIDCIHSFQYYPFLASCFAQMFTGVPCIYSIIGPFRYYYIPKFYGKVIAYCGEFRDNVVKKNPKINPNDVSIICNRLDLQKYRPGVNGSKLISQFNLNNNNPKVVMLSRFHKVKMNAISDLIDAVPYVLKKIPDAQFIIAGDGEHFTQTKQQVEKLNQQFGKQAIILTGAINEVPQMLNIATLVVGVGRSVLEGMACQKPAIVVGEKGYAGIVSPETVEKIAYFNFAGRNISERNEPDKLADAIIKIITDPEYASFLGNFSRNFVEKEFDVKFGAERLEKIYIDLIDKKDSEKMLRTDLFFSLISTFLLTFHEDLIKGFKDIRNGKINHLMSKIYKSYGC